MSCLLAGLLIFPGALKSLCFLVGSYNPCVNASVHMNLLVLCRPCVASGISVLSGVYDVVLVYPVA